MKCPKCHYLSFEPEPRCRHCGHDFSVAEPDLFSAPAQPLAEATAPPPPSPAAPGPTPFDEIVLQRDPPPGPVPSLGLMRPERLPGAAAPRPPLPVRQGAPPPTTELPLFVAGLDRATVEPAPGPASPPAPPGPRLVHLEAPVTVPAAPRPLSVRRASVDPGRPRAQTASPRPVGPIDRDLLEDLDRLDTEDRRRTPPAIAASDASGASLPTRMAAGAVDVALLGLLNAVAIVLTLRLSDLALADLPWTAALPLVMFLWLVDLGYLLLFTASGGQTVGQMALGLRVVDVSHDRPRARLTVAQAAYRSLLTFPSVLALGAGFLPALIGRGGALHDRLSHTRVIRA